MMSQRERTSLDRYITGNYGEDQFRPDYDTRDREGGDDVDGTPDEINETLRKQNLIDTMERGDGAYGHNAPIEFPLTREPGARLTSAADATAFMMAGNAYFTLRSKQTGVRYTYRVSRSKDAGADQATIPGVRCRWCRSAPCVCPVRYFVGLLTGADNTNDYSYLGMIEPKTGFRLTKNSRMSFESAPVVAFSWAFTALKAGRLPEKLEVWHSGRCGRCGKRLTVPESIARGLGPECAGKENF